MKENADLAKLVELCAQKDESFRQLHPVVAPLTPYAVELRYDEEFWPTEEAAKEAGSAVAQVREFMSGKIPKTPA